MSLNPKFTAPILAKLYLYPSNHVTESLLINSKSIITKGNRKIILDKQCSMVVYVDSEKSFFNARHCVQRCVFGTKRCSLQAHHLVYRCSAF